MARAITVLFVICVIVVFYGLGQTDVGLFIGFQPRWTNSTKGELYTWIGIAFLVLPACIMGVWALSDLVEDAAVRAWKKVSETTAKQRRLAAGGIFTAALAAAVAGNFFIVKGFPVTDDEWAARYGGELMASGRLTEKVPEYFGGMPHLFLYARDGMVAAFDWPGALWPWTVGELVGIPNIVFQILAALALVGVVVGVTERLGAAWGLAAGLLFLTSPMASALSVTTHTHVISRGFIALSLAAWALAHSRKQTRFWALAGLFAGLAWMSRPPETTLLLGPLTLVALFNAIRDPEARKPAAALIGFGAISVALFVAHSYGITESILPPRFAPNDIKPWAGSHHKSPFAIIGNGKLFWHRFGANSGYNLLMLTVYGLGALALPLIWLGARRDAFTKALAAGLVLDLSLGLLHDDYGLHIVGPIHYSEAVVPIIYLALQGMHDLHERLETTDLPRHRLLLAVVLGMAISNGIFSVQHLRALEKQGRIHETVYGALDDPKLDNSVVLAPFYADIWKMNHRFKTRGSFVFDWRRVKPGGQERVVIIHDVLNDEQYAALRKAYPDRKFFRGKKSRKKPFVTFHEVP